SILYLHKILNSLFARHILSYVNYWRICATLAADRGSGCLNIVVDTFYERFGALIVRYGLVCPFFDGFRLVFYALAYVFFYKSFGSYLFIRICSCKQVCFGNEQLTIGLIQRCS